MQPGYGYDPLARVAGLDRFFVQQKFAPIANVYRVFTVGPDGNPAEPLAYVKQKRMKIREQIDFYTDESQTVPLMRLQARKVFEFRGMTDVLLPNGGQVIGSVKKNFAKSLLRSSWSVLDPSGREVATAREKSMFFAVLRRVWGSSRSSATCRTSSRSTSTSTGRTGGCWGRTCGAGRCATAI